MFTLKITTTAPAPDASRPITWLADVTMVTLITRGGREFMDTQTAPGPRPGPYWPAVDLATGAGPDAILSLLYVVRRRGNDEHSEYVLVEWAWLLGPDGQTIERIAP